MQIAISTLTVDPNGAVVFNVVDSSADVASYSRRIVKVPTLDGGATVIDGGYTAADRSISVVLENVSKATFEQIRTIFQTYATVLLFLPDGAFKASPEQMTYSSATPTLRMSISGVGEVKLT